MAAKSESRASTSPSTLVEVKSSSAPEEISASQEIEQTKSAQRTLASFKKPANWIVSFGVALAICAGIVDAVGYHLWHQFVTNQTGNVARLAMEVRDIHLESDEWFQFRDAGVVLCCFIGGAFLCGLMIDKNQVHLGGKSSYGLALVGNALLLVVATYLAGKEKGPHSLSGRYFAAAASGLQNAMCTSHFGAVVRTTHITGTVTDIGSTTGRMVMILLRKRCRFSQLNIVEKAEIEVDMKKLVVLLPIVCGFWLGCFLGAYLEVTLHEYALLIPAALTGLGGFIYMFFRNHLKQKFKRIELKRLTKDLLEVDGALVRAHSHLAELRHQLHEKPESEGSNGDDQDKAVVDLDEEVEHALEVVHEMEMTIDELRSEQTHKDHASPNHRHPTLGASPSLRHVTHNASPSNRQMTIDV